MQKRRAQGRESPNNRSLTRLGVLGYSSHADAAFAGGPSGGASFESAGEEAAIPFRLLRRALKATPRLSTSFARLSRKSLDHRGRFYSVLQRTLSAGTVVEHSWRQKHRSRFPRGRVPQREVPTRSLPVANPTLLAAASSPAVDSLPMCTCGPARFCAAPPNSFTPGCFPVPFARSSSCCQDSKHSSCRGVLLLHLTAAAFVLVLIKLLS